MSLPLEEKRADLTERIIDALRTVYDPEIPVNIYDLGLIYSIDLRDLDTDKPSLHVAMTLTTAHCPLAGMILNMVHKALTDHIADINEIDVKLVWDPPWDSSRMSDEARDSLEFMF
ncbi:MAG: iron-sulfur cluster assembly protein [Alphaproteobacteria bacterium]|nr:iron-sulfur cluster assembly protein [Alphaproteobacteria bacterium]